MALTDTSAEGLWNQLDSDIEHVRAEIQSLTKAKNLLTGSLLSSTKIQSSLAARSASPTNKPSELTPLQAKTQHGETKIHRLAYGVTSFPYTDPNPDTSNRPLLGIRFDILSRSGKFEKTPYYIFLKRVHGNESDIGAPIPAPAADINPETDLKIHHHTIPALVPLQDYETRYLPQTAPSLGQDNIGRDEGYYSPSPSTSSEADNGDDEPPRKRQQMARRTQTRQGRSMQDLHALVAAVRRDLVSWQLRNDAITLLAEKLQLSPEDKVAGKPGKLSLQSLQATAIDARFCRLVWRNGTVGRLRLTDDGYVDRAVVIGDIGMREKTQRIHVFEQILSTGKNGGRLPFSNLWVQLERVETKMGQMTRISQQIDESENMELVGTNSDRDE